MNTGKKPPLALSAIPPVVRQPMPGYRGEDDKLP
jgi:hypothetical protein